MIVYLYILIESDFSKYYCKKIKLPYSYLNYVDTLGSTNSW